MNGKVFHVKKWRMDNSLQKSSIWPGLKWSMEDVQKGTRWIKGESLRSLFPDNAHVIASGFESS